MKALIQRLAEAYGPSGREGAVRDLVQAELRDLPVSQRVDALGNLIVETGQRRRGGRRVLLAAHMDEIGLVASHVDRRGFVRFQPLGGVNVLAAPGSRVRFASGRCGVVGVETRRDEPAKPPGFADMYIDVGAASRDDCPVQVGDTAVFDGTVASVDGRLIGKSLDDRVGVAILLEVLRRLRRGPHEVVAVFSVQEEVGRRGAGPAAYGVEPDLGLAIDVTATGDTPNGRRMAVSLGAGPAIKVRDAGMLADPRLKDLLLQRAEAAGLPCQREVLEGGSTDAASLQVARGGMPAGAVSIPCRYVHTPSEMVDWGDVQAAVALLLALLRQPITL